MHSYAKFMLHTLNRVEANSSDLVCVSAWFIFMCFTLPNRSQPCQLWLSFSTAMTLHHIILWIYNKNTDAENNNRQISDVSMSFRYNGLHINYIIYSVLYKYDVRLKSGHIKMILIKYWLFSILLLFQQTVWFLLIFSLWRHQLMTKGFGLMCIPHIPMTRFIFSDGEIAKRRDNKYWHWFGWYFRR